MTATELFPVSQDIGMAANEVGYRAGKMLRACLGDGAESVTAEGGASLGSRITLEALSNMGILPDNFDHETFYTELGRIELIALTGMGGH